MYYREEIRDWLVDSPSCGRLYGYLCKLFSPHSDITSSQFQTSFDDWKNANVRVSSHYILKENLSPLSLMAQHWKYTCRVAGEKMSDSVPTG